MQTWPPYVSMNEWEYNTDIGTTGVPTTFEIFGPMANVLTELAKSFNFTYLQVRPPDGGWGDQLPNGTSTGMLGQVARREVDMALGPFAIVNSRFQATDMYVPVHYTTLGILAARGSPSIDPWGFTMPMTPAVWLLLGISLLLVSASHILLGFLQPKASGGWNDWKYDALFRYSQQPLNQAIKLKKGMSQWHRVLLGTWLLGSSLFSWSYSGNLISHMTLRHIPHPIQTLRDLIEATHVKVIFEPDTAFTATISRVQFGDIKDLHDLKFKGRHVYLWLWDFMQYVNLIREEDHVQVFDKTTAHQLMGQDFSEQGRCDFYWAKESFLPFMFSMIGQKNSPLTPAMNVRMYWIVESGLFSYWMTSVMPNSTACANAPTKVTLEESLGLNNIWGLAVVWGIGLLLATVSFMLELIFGKRGE